MLFTNATFIALFLPIVLIGYFLIGRRSEQFAALWLFAASVFFYGYWMPEFTLLLLASIAVNFTIGGRIGAAWGSGSGGVARTRLRRWLTAGIVFNLGLLGYFKYANFFVDNLNATLGAEWDLARVVLPMPAPGGEWKSWRRYRGIPVAPEGSIEYDPLRGARWRRK